MSQLNTAESCGKTLVNFIKISEFFLNFYLNFVIKTVKAMERIEEIKQKRQNQFIMNRFFIL